MVENLGEMMFVSVVSVAVFLLFVGMVKDLLSFFSDVED